MRRTYYKFYRCIGAIANTQSIPDSLLGAAHIDPKYSPFDFSKAKVGYLNSTTDPHLPCSVVHRLSDEKRAFWPEVIFLIYHGNFFAIYRRRAIAANARTLKVIWTRATSILRTEYRRIFF